MRFYRTLRSPTTPADRIRLGKPHFISRQWISGCYYGGKDPQTVARKLETARREVDACLEQVRARQKRLYDAKHRAAGVIQPWGRGTSVQTLSKSWPIGKAATSVGWTVRGDPSQEAQKQTKGAGARR